MPQRYGFYKIFGYNQTTGFLYPLFDTWINNAMYPAGMNINRGPSFGGIDLYSLMGRDVAGIWNNRNRSLTIVGFY